MRRVVVLGATGMLGQALVAELSARAIPHVAPARKELDLTRAVLETELAARSPAAVINAAAYTDVARAELESERALCYRLNRDMPAELARACRRLSVPLVHVSTDYVFDGRRRQPYREDDATAPLQAYGWSKLEGERAVLAANPRALVVRTSTLYGAGRSERPHYVDAVLRQAHESTTVAVVALPVSCPTWSVDLARALIDLLEAGARGVVHAAGQGGCSRLELAREIVRLAGLALKTQVLERAASLGGPRRPDYSVLDLSRLAAITGRPMRPWQDGLADYLASPT